MSADLLDIQALANDVQQALALAGTIWCTGAAVAPPSWRLCDGTAVPRWGDYTDLFRAIGTRWGVGDGTTTFNVPDLIGVLPFNVPPWTSLNWIIKY